MLEKSKGTTPSERYLSHLCKGTFLSLWSYPNVFRDQGNAGTGGDGKEVCDLLVVCGDDVIIFSDKSCDFKDTGNVKKDWSRWYRRAIKKSADQLHGAQRWIREFPDRLFLDRCCKTTFPLDLANIRHCRFHLIVVALGAAARCRKEIGGSGSLILCPDIVGAAHSSDDCHPFFVGDVDPRRDFIHVFDDVTLDVVLRELDTITDFVGYLRHKEEFVRAGKLALAAGEENLLAYYMSKMGEVGHEIQLPEGFDRLVVEDGHWTRHIDSSEYGRKKKANEKSYIWDHLIEEVCRHTIQGTALPPSVQSVTDAERGFRVMARENRLARRVLAEAWINRLATASNSKASMRTVLSNDDPNTAYVFLTAPEGNQDETNYRNARRAYLESYCFVLAWKRRLRTIVGVATEPGVTQASRSHDLMVYEPSEWTEDMERDAKKLQQELGILHDDNLQIRRIHDDEYPVPKKPGRSRQPMKKTISSAKRRTKAGRIGRNDRCPCGSGRKFKHCCLRQM